MNEIKLQLVDLQKKQARMYAAMTLLKEYKDTLEVIQDELVSACGLPHYNEYPMYYSSHSNVFKMSATYDVSMDELLDISAKGLKDFKIDYNSLNYQCTGLTLKYYRTVTTGLIFEAYFEAKLSQEDIDLLKIIGKIGTEESTTEIVTTEARIYSMC